MVSNILSVIKIRLHTWVQNKQNFVLLSKNKLLLYSLAAGEAAWVIFQVQSTLD